MKERGRILFRLAILTGLIVLGAPASTILPRAAIRPSQLDNGITPLFPVPNFPSYPSNHTTNSSARSEILAYLFPAHADEIRLIGKEGGDSRVWAGIHYPIDLDAGNNPGKSVAQKFIDWAKSDGSQ